MKNIPLAERIRPSSLDEMVGQTHLFGKKGIITRFIEAQHLPNLVLYGPPGTGKTTLANILAKQSGKYFKKLNATTASISDVKEAIQASKNVFGSQGLLLYLDEIQYFNKKQQQTLLEYIEDGSVTLISATTENPYFSIYNAILSRSTVIEFKSITPREQIAFLRKGLDELNNDNHSSITSTDETLVKVAFKGGGDLRHSLTILENLFYASENELDDTVLENLCPVSTGNFDANDDVHYNLLSAFQKSIRGSDPDAAIFYLAKIIAGGDILSACRRLLVIASEDIGLAYPQAISITYACVEAAKQLGLPEASLPLSEATILLATSPKSNSSYEAFASATEDIQNGLGQEFPTILKSPLFKGYKYPHMFPNHYVEQEYLPQDIRDKQYYKFGDNAFEKKAKEYFDYIKKNK